MIVSTVIAVVPVRSACPPRLLSHQRKLCIDQTNGRHGFMAKQRRNSRMPVLPLPHAQLKVPSSNNADLINGPCVALSFVFVDYKALVHCDVGRRKKRHVCPHAPVISQHLSIECKVDRVWLRPVSWWQCNNPGQTRQGSRQHCTRANALYMDVPMVGINVAHSPLRLLYIGIRRHGHNGVCQQLELAAG